MINIKHASETVLIKRVWWTSGYVARHGPFIFLISYSTLPLFQGFQAVFSFFLRVYLAHQLQHMAPTILIVSLQGLHYPSASSSIILIHILGNTCREYIAALCAVQVRILAALKSVQSSRLIFPQVFQIQRHWCQRHLFGFSGECISWWSMLEKQ